MNLQKRPRMRANIDLNPGYLKRLPTGTTEKTRTREALNRRRSVSTESAETFRQRLESLAQELGSTIESSDRGGWRDLRNEVLERIDKDFTSDFCVPTSVSKGACVYVVQ